jgi:hypothetical protein
MLLMLCCHGCILLLELLSPLLPLLFLPLLLLKLVLA